MKDKKKPIPVRFDSTVMQRCQDILTCNPHVPCNNASDVARNAMEYGLKAMEDLFFDEVTDK